MREIAERAHDHHRLLAGQRVEDAFELAAGRRRRRRAGRRWNSAARVPPDRRRRRLPGRAPCRRAGGRAGGCRRAAAGPGRSRRPCLSLAESPHADACALATRGPGAPLRGSTRRARMARKRRTASRTGGPMRISSARWLRALLGVVVLAAVPPAFAKDKPKSDFGTLEYRSVGPAISGRATRVAGVPGDPLTYYAADRQGGVWKSEDGGHDWKPVFDDQPTNSIGSIAVAPSDPNVVYVGTGEANIRGNVALGQRHLQVDRRRQDLAAGLEAGRPDRHDGRASDESRHRLRRRARHALRPEPGARRLSHDATAARPGSRCSTRTSDTGASDVALRSEQPAHRLRRPLAGAAPALGPDQRRPGQRPLRLARRRRHLEAAHRARACPTAIWGKVGVARRAVELERVYALIEAEKGGLFRSDDGGETWELASDHHALRQRAWYYSTLTVDPTNADVVWFPQVPLLRDDRRRQDDRVGRRRPHHGDHHDVWIDPTEPAADDRRQRRRRRPQHRRRRDLVRAAAADRAVLQHRRRRPRARTTSAGTMQDLGTAQRPGNSLRSGRGSGGPRSATGTAWAAARPATSSPTRRARTRLRRRVPRHHLATTRRARGKARNVGAYPRQPLGHAGEGREVPLPVDRADRGLAARPEDRSTTAPTCCSAPRDGGADLGRRSARDLTRNDKSKQQWSGGPITGDNTGVEFYDTIFSIAESPLAAGVIWVGHATTAWCT